MEWYDVTKENPVYTTVDMADKAARVALYRQMDEADVVSAHVGDVVTLTGVYIVLTDGVNRETGEPEDKRRIYLFGTNDAGEAVCWFTMSRGVYNSLARMWTVCEDLCGERLKVDEVRSNGRRAFVLKFA